MRTILATLAVSLLGGLPAAQAPRGTNSLEFRSGAKITVSHHQIDLAGGVTLQNLMKKGETGDQFRTFFNQSGFKRVVGGRLELSRPTSIGDSDLDAGKYQLSFRIDNDLIWYAVILNKEDEEICSIVLKAKETKNPAKTLVIRPIAASNKKDNGHLEVHFGKLVAQVPFRCHKEDK